MATEEINLWNFEEERFCDSAHVLTSPRSLKACNNLSVKPNELLYHTLSEFHEQGLAEGTPFKAVYDLYDTCERKRLENLSRCREERLKIVQRELERDFNDLQVDTTSNGGRSQSTQPPARSDTPPTLPHRSESLQRGRTYSVFTDLYHKHDTDLGYISDGAEVQGHQPRRPRSLSMGSFHQMAPSVDRSTWSAYRPMSAGSRISLTGRWNGSGDEGQGGRVGTPRLDGSTSHRVNRRKRRGLKRTAIKEKDQRIIKAMLLKRETEVDQEVSRCEALLQREAEKDKYDQASLQRERSRRASLAESIVISEKKKEWAKEQKKEEEELRLAERVTSCLLNDARTTRLVSDRKYSQALALEMKKKNDIKRRLSQKSAVQIQSRRDERTKTELWYKQQANLLRASIKRDRKLAREQQEKRKANEKEKAASAKKLQEVKKRERVHQESMTASLELRHLKAEKNHLRQIRSQESLLTQRMKEREVKVSESRERMSSMERKLQGWREELYIQKEMAARNAQAAASALVEEKARKARKERESRQKVHQKKYHSLIEETEGRTEGQKVAIALKDMKSSDIKRQREKTLHEMRVSAAESQAVRESVRRQYGADEFHRKALRVALEEQVGTGRITATRNESKVLLG